MRDELGLTIKQRRFVEVFVDPNSNAFLNGRQAVLIVYETRKLGSADRMQWDLLRKPKIRAAVQDRLESQDISELIAKGVRERLKDPYSRHWQPTADFVAKVRGEFDSKRKVVRQGLGPEERQKFYRFAYERIEEPRKQVLDQTRQIEAPGSK